MDNKDLDECLIAYQGKNIYDFDNEILLKWYPERIIKALDITKKSSLLELGIGHGYTAEIFSKHFEHHVILDGSSAVIENFKAKYPKNRAEIIETYFENYNGDEKFDVIVMGFILEHVEDPAVVLSHFKQFLNPGGKIFIAVPNAEVLNRRLGHLIGMLDDMETLSENDHLLGHRRYYTAKTFTEELEKSGYKVDTLEGIYMKPFTTSQMISLALNEQVIDSLCQVGIDYPELSCGILAQVSTL